MTENENIENVENLENLEQNDKITKVNIDEEMRSSYIDYAMSVIVSRALPDVRDGLKPVQRRVMYGMNDLGLQANRTYKKSARIVGEVLGKYHPHGDSSVYFAMVRMAQSWSLRYPLVDGQGNFGSVDGDPPAAMRYTEARLTKIAEEMLADIDKDTVDFQLNFDDTLEEPKVLPARIPNLLINGASGIAVGMATNMPPHNLSEVIDGTIAFINNGEITIDELMEHIKAPDFPTGGFIYGIEGIKEAFRTGKGQIVMRARYNIEATPSGKDRIVITEFPYLVNKADFIQKAAELANDKKIEGIVYANDESDRDGTRAVIVLRRDAVANVVINQLYKMTELQSTFNVNNIALVHGRPKLLNLKDLIHNFVEHRHDVVLRRTKYELSQAEKKAHILAGLLIALDHLDEVISLIRNSKTPDEAKDGLMANFELSEIQAKAILEMRLQRLTGLERDKIRTEYDELMKLIAYLKEILADKNLRSEIIKTELLEIKEKYGDKRRSEIIYTSEELNPEDFYADEPMVITISHLGYIKRTQLTEFRTQNRGGKGAIGSATRDEDFIRHIYIATMHNTMLFFSENGKVYWLKVYEIPEGTKTSKGRAIQNLLNIEGNDFIRAYMNVESLHNKEYIENHYIVLCTKRGIIKKTTLEEFSRPRQNGIIAITVNEGDALLEAKLTNGNNEIIIAARSGKAIRFHESTVRHTGRTSAGVRAISIGEDDRVMGMVCTDNQSMDILVVSENGYGKRSLLEDYRFTNRGGKGVKTMKLGVKTGQLIAIKGVVNEDDLMIITKSGVTIRMSAAKIRTQARDTQGVRLINLKDDDQIAAVARVDGKEFQEAGVEVEPVENVEGLINTELSEENLVIEDIEMPEADEIADVPTDDDEENE